MCFFTGGKKQKEKENAKKENAQEKNFAAENRKNGEEIEAALRTAAARAVGIREARKSAEFSARSLDLAENIHKSRTCGYDLSKIDSELKKLVEEYGNALYYGDNKCAAQAGTLINDIMNAREKLAKCQKADAEKETEKVAAFAMNSYNLVRFYNILRECKENFERSKAQYKDAHIEYSDQLERVDSMERANPAAAQLLATRIPGQTLTPQANQLQTQIDILTGCLENLKMIEVAKNDILRHSEILKLNIRKAEIALALKDSLLSAEEIQAMQDIIDDFVKTLVEINDQTEALQKLGTNSAAAIVAINNNIDADRRKIAAYETYVANKRAAQEQMLAQEAARKQAHEQKTEQENDQRLEN